tara:strand:+ start:217 stop:504 length:288 start_codon:yes stop_codon:yes gene_type:complete
MEIEQIKNYSYNIDREILEFDYSLVGDPQDTYRNILIEKEKFEDYYTFPSGTSWDDEEGYYEVDVDLQLDDTMLIESLETYLDVNEDECGEVIKE